MIDVGALAERNRIIPIPDVILIPTRNGTKIGTIPDLINIPTLYLTVGGVAIRRVYERTKELRKAVANTKPTFQNNNENVLTKITLFVPYTRLF